MLCAVCLVLCAELYVVCWQCVVCSFVLCAQLCAQLCCVLICVVCSFVLCAQLCCVLSCVSDGSANQLRQLKTSLSQHQELLDGREQESHHFALACEEAAATKAALDAERAHSASLQADIRKLADELAIEEAALVKETAKREAAESKWSVAAAAAAECADCC